MKKILALLVANLVIGLTLLLPASALAVDVLSPACQTDPNSTLCRSNSPQSKDGNSIYGPNGILTKGASLFAVVVGAASVVMIIIGGFKYVMSSGDPSNVKSAKDTVLFAIIGILVALTAQSIVVLVLKQL